MQVRRILAPVDFSDASRDALDYASAFARLLKARLTVLHSVEAPELPRRLAAFAHRVKATALDQAREDVTEFAARAASAADKLATEIVAGGPRDEIIRALSRLKADLVIMATSGRTGLKRLWLGSVAEHVVRHASCPVLVVRRQKRAWLRAVRRK